MMFFRRADKEARAYLALQPNLQPTTYSLREAACSQPVQDVARSWIQYHETSHQHARTWSFEQSHATGASGSSEFHRK